VILFPWLSQRGCLLGWTAREFADGKVLSHTYTHRSSRPVAIRW
jgi:hypothetical protein